MRKLNTIQTQENLNEVYACDEPGNGGASHIYKITDLDEHTLIYISFQNGPRAEAGSTRGILDTDLLEIVRDRMKSFQSGEFASEYTERALVAVEEALYQMNLRVENRIRRGVLGKLKK